MGAKVTAVDFSSQQIKQAGLLADRYRASIEFKAVDIGSLSVFNDDCFDLAISACAISFVKNIDTAFSEVYRILKPGGVLLATLPGISQKSNDEWGAFWCWSFTTLSAKLIFEEVFPATNITIKAYGNVLAATTFLYGLATRELRRSELDYHDPDYELLITVKAMKPGTIS